MMAHPSTPMNTTRTEWEHRIDTLRSTTTQSNPEEVTNALISAVKTNTPSTQFGIFLSGGVDSSLLAFIAKSQGAQFTCYCAGLEGAEDPVWADKAARALGLTLKIKTFPLDEMESLFKRTAKLLPTPDVLSVGVGAVIVAAADLAKQDGVTTFLGGLGSEEIFAGYERHAKATDINDECWRGLRGLFVRDLTRDLPLAAALGIDVRCPFLDDGLIITAMGVPGEKKLNASHKKVVLREIAEQLGLPKEFAWRKKTAAQYGSKFDYALEKLAKRKGMTKREYVASLASC